MAWIDGQEAKTPPVNWNAELSKLKGELQEDEARKSLGRFLMHNIGFTVKILTGITLAPYQRLMIKGWFLRNFTLCVAGRGGSKSTMFAIFAYLYCLFNPGQKVLIVSATFRSSRRILEQINDWANRKEGTLLRQTFFADMVKKQDNYEIKFLNSASIIAVPLGDANKLRGFRCNVLGIDEGLLIPQQTIDLVLKPFLIAGANITEKQAIRERETFLIKKGKMKEEDRMVFDSASKMIILSSASYTFEHLYSIYGDYLKKIYNVEGKDKTERDGSTYLVQQYSYEIVPEELLDDAVKTDIKSGSTPQEVLDREYRAIFTQGSDGYFSAKKMANCTVPDGSQPCAEIVGEKGAEYLLAIDPSVGHSASGDHFAMCVIKIVKKANGKKIGLVVHNYAEAGCALGFHIQYLRYILKKFNIIYVACDTTQGEMGDFISICNESEIFKQEKLELLPIQASFTNEDFKEMVKDVRRSYNPSNNTIVQKQNFASSFQRSANEYLKACFDFENIMFAGKIDAVPDVQLGMAEADIENIHKIHPSFSEDSMYEFITLQDLNMTLVKRECALIQVTSSQLGNLSYDLPQNMKRNRSVTRPRKDSYSALFLGAWALRIYLEAQEIPMEDDDSIGVPLLV